MKHMLLLLLGTMLALCGCSSTKLVEYSQREQWMGAAQRDLVGSYATVQTTDGRAAAGEIYRLDTDSLFVGDDEGRTISAFELGRVSFIRQPTSAWPAVGGFVGGLLIGAFVGGAIGTEEAVQADNVESGIETFVWTPVIGGVLGGVAGAAIIGGATSSTNYEIVHMAPRKSSAHPSAAIPDSTLKPK